MSSPPSVADRIPTEESKGHALRVSCFLLLKFESLSENLFHLERVAVFLWEFGDEGFRVLSALVRVRVGSHDVADWVFYPSSLYLSSRLLYLVDVFQYRAYVQGEIGFLFFRKLD